MRFDSVTHRNVFLFLVGQNDANIAIWDRYEGDDVTTTRVAVHLEPSLLVRLQTYRVIAGCQGCVPPPNRIRTFLAFLPRLQRTWQ